MAEEPSKSSSSNRSSLGSPSRPNFRYPPMTLVTQSTLTDQEDDAHSRETVKAPFTPVQQCLSELSLDIQPKDATTPVLIAGQSPLPPPPDSPSIKLTAAPNISSCASGSSGYGSNQQLTGGEASQLDYLGAHRDSMAIDTTIRNLRDRPGSYKVKKQAERKNKKNIGIVIGDFHGLYGDELTIKVGQEIEIMSKDTVVSRNIGWWTGRTSSGIGIFPAACVSCDTQGAGAAGSGSTPAYPLEIKNSEVEMKEPIGMGGFGKVYRAIYRGEEVAVKVAKSTTFDIVKAVQDVMSEAQKFAHLAHANICALVGVVLVKDICLVMEYAKGGALSDVIHKRGISLSVDVITSWTVQIAAGMHYLHHEAKPSLIHRDLKTSNSEFLLLQGREGGWMGGFKHGF